MIKAVAINGSPRMERGNTALVLDPFIQGMMDGGSEVDQFYASRLKVKPCSCGRMQCWNDSSGECCIQDDMQTLCPKLKAADILILAAPVYVPLPGEMQNVINRLVPLIDPVLEKRQGRTRARFRNDVNIHKIVLVVVSGWWEIENCETVVRIAKEFAEDASVEFGGAVLRPHSSYLKKGGKITPDGEDVLAAVKMAGKELILSGSMRQDTLERISRPLVPEE